MEPIFETSHNLRAIGKELSLLEDHLLQPTRRCNDCIRKHLVRAEAFGEEGISLDRTGQHVDVITGILGQIRALQGPALSGDVDRHQLGQVVRKLRKKVCKIAYDPMDTWDGVAAARRGGSAAMATPKVKLEPGQKVIYRWNKVWYPGKVLPIGSKVTGYDVTSIPQDGYFALEAPDGTSQMWVKEGVVVPAPTGTPMSQVFGRFGKINRYGKRGVGRTPIDSQRALVLDVIQSVLDRELAFLPPAVRQEVIKGAIINAAYESDLDPLADTKKTPRYKAWVAAGKPDPRGPDFDGKAMLAEDSVGLFQLNVPYGAGKGMTQEERENAVLNTVRIAQEFKNRTSEQAPIKPAKIETARRALGLPVLGDLVRDAAAGKPVSAGQWAAAWALQVERPWDPMAGGKNRKRTGDEMFPPVGTAPLPKAPERVAPPPPTTPGAAAPGAPLVAPSRITDEGMNPRKAQAWLVRWGVFVNKETGQVTAVSTPAAYPWAVEGVRNALAQEDRAKAAGVGTVAYKEALTQAAEQWRDLGLRSQQEWPLARAVAVATLAGATSLVYGLHQLIIVKHPESRLAVLARKANDKLKRQLPAAYLTSDDERRDLKPVLAGVALVGAAMLGALLMRGGR
jgi:hypothetical protein